MRLTANARKPPSWTNREKLDALRRLGHRSPGWDLLLRRRREKAIGCRLCGERRKSKSRKRRVCGGQRWTAIPHVSTPAKTTSR